MLNPHDNDACGWVAEARIPDYESSGVNQA
jgi:hypothetical protein